MSDAPTHTADWSDIRALLGVLGEVTVDGDGNLTVTRNGHVFMLHPAFTKGPWESGEVNALRRFLQDSESAPAGATGRDPHLLVVIRGAEARLYRCQVSAGVPQLILPYEAEKPESEQRPTRKRPSAPAPAPVPPPAPGEGGFFAAIADQLKFAGQIVIFGGTGTEAAAFVAWLNEHDPELSGRVIGTLCLDEACRDNAGLLVAARAFYAKLNLAAPKLASDPLSKQWSGGRADWPKTAAGAA